PSTTAPTSAWFPHEPGHRIREGWTGPAAAGPGQHAPEMGAGTGIPFPARAGSRGGRSGRPALGTLAAGGRRGGGDGGGRATGGDCRHHHGRAGAAGGTARGGACRRRL